MPTKNELLDAARKQDWMELEPLLLELSNEQRSAQTTWLVQEIRQQGYMICRRPAPEEIARRDNFLQSFTIYLKANDLVDLAEAWRRDDGLVAAIEWGYHKILDTVTEQVEGHVPPNCIAWASLKHLEVQASKVRAASIEFKPAQGQPLDSATMRVRLPDGSEVQPDDYLQGLNDAATATLKMLGIGNKWFRTDGRLALPTPSSNVPSDTDRIENVLTLAAVWQALERSDQHVRFFGNNAELQRQEFAAKDGVASTVEVLRFDLESSDIIHDRIAHERRNRSLMQFWNQLTWETSVDQKISKLPPVPLPPNAFVSFDEALSDIALSQFLCKAIVEHDEELGGLRIIEWVRAYACLRLFAGLKLSSDEGPVAIERSELLEFLKCRGLIEAKAERFIASIIFSRRDPDLFDAPLLETFCGSLFLCANIALAINPVEVVLSKLATIRVSLAWRGAAFEIAVQEFFREKGIPIEHLDLQVEGEPLEVDCVIHWDGVLFVVECKNISLSGKNEESTYRFFQEQRHALDQVKKKRNTLLAHPEILERVFGKPLQLKRTVAVVLNAMPFSLGEVAKDTYVYDYSALRRFFEGRYFNVIMPAKMGKVSILRRHGVKAVWSGDKPTPQDLIVEMVKPLQVAMCLARYSWTPISLPLSRQAILRTSKAIRTIGSLEADLNAIGLDGSRLVSEIENVHGEFSMQIEGVKQRLNEENNKRFDG